MKRMAAISAVVLATTACTTINVTKIEASKHPISLVCIKVNPKVLVGDFLTVVEAGFLRHGIEVEVFEGQAPSHCEYIMSYTALRGWDLAPYMDQAELRLMREGKTVGLATYRHSGGFGFNKWASTESKMTPVIDELLAEF